MLHDDVKVDKTKLVPAAACQRTGHSQQLFIPYQMPLPVQAILIPAKYHKGLERLAYEH